MSKTSKPENGSDPKKAEPKKKGISIPLTVLPSDEETADDEMNEMFNEDKVKHKHGGAEPERD
jgi:hypothetical protein